MNARLVKAMARCCATKAGDTLAQPTLVGGELCATDRVVAVRYWEPGWDPDKMPKGPWQLYAHEIGHLKPAARIGVSERGFEIPKGTSHGYPAERYPALCDMWEDLGRNPNDYVLDYDPGQVKRVLDVFSAAGANFAVVDRGHALEFHGWNHRTKATVHAMVMGCRR